MAVAAVNATTPAMANAEASMDTDSKMVNGLSVVPKPRKFKASELPLPSSTRSAIEDLAHSFKKKGGYDETRKNVWETFESSVCPNMLGRHDPIVSSFQILTTDWLI